MEPSPQLLVEHGCRLPTQSLTRLRLSVAQPSRGYYSHLPPQVREVHRRRRKVSCHSMALPGVPGKRGGAQVVQPSQTGLLLSAPGSFCAVHGLLCLG